MQQEPDRQVSAAFFNSCSLSANVRGSFLTGIRCHMILQFDGMIEIISG